MTITHATPLRVILAEDVAAFVDTGAGTATLVIYDDDDVALASFNLANPAYDSDAAGTLTLRDAPLSASGLAIGIASKFKVFNRDGALAYGGSVGTDGTSPDLTVPRPAVFTGQNCVLLSHAYRAPV